MAVPNAAPVLEAADDTGARVANVLAEALPAGPEVAMAAARGFTDRELVLGVAFCSIVMEVAAISTRMMADIQKERRGLGAGKRAEMH